ncbi:Nucleotide-binding universal stress protein, UspA family [Poseidonocella pacifica]|uniref:Nucleotide-binding universal stress protein, UspA family n=1 Tax=Poseidonocella pacifica TaxID=871651 RepID=A0A1I0VI85_9RHOB|nr:universal stress protein [Poseidonocella pacifica]SFA75747.1 Nucleotide-binding universal stress protein, UspA family [Poseidonocella pacifica]
MFNKILVPIDLNQPDSWEKVLPAVDALAGPEGEVHLLAVLHDLGSAMVGSYLPDGFERHAVETATAQLEAFVAEHFPNRSNVTPHLSHGHVPEVVLATAKKIGADLIAMASHPPDGFRTFFVGSYADKIVHHAPMPVLVMR